VSISEQISEAPIDKILMWFSGQSGLHFGLDQDLHLQAAR